MPGEVLAVFLHKEKNGEKNQKKNMIEENTNCSAALAQWMAPGKGQ